MLLRRRGSVDWSEREGRRYLCGDYLSYRGLGALVRRPAFGAIHGYAVCFTFTSVLKFTDKLVWIYSSHGNICLCWLCLSR